MSETPKYIEHYIDIDLLSGKVHIHDEGGKLNIQSDNRGHRLLIKLFDGTNEYDPTTEDTIIQFVYQKPGGEKSDCVVTADSQWYVIADVPVQALDVAGIVQCEIRITNASGTWVSSAKFNITVSKAIYNARDMDDIEEYKSAYEQILESEFARQDNEANRITAEAARQNAEAARSRLSEELVAYIHEQIHEAIGEAY